MRLFSTLSALFVIAMPVLASAQPLYEPPSESPPPTAAPTVVQQAGSASDIKYGQQGVLEAGGSMGLTIASNLRDVNVSPSLGYFLGDNFEVSGILGMSNVKAGNESSTVWSALAEPSFHFQLDRQLYGFIGVGVGGAYIDGLGTALAVAPRVGMNFVVGTSGVLSPSLSYEYTMHDTMTAKAADGTTDVTLLAVSSTLRANIGYTVMW
jgi:hypothetical protein